MIEIIRLVWNDWNIAHIARHNVMPNEVEEICQSDCLVLDGHSGRLLIIGLTQAKRPLAVVLDPEKEVGTYYPVTARTADRKERRLYQDKKGDQYDKAA